MREIVLDTETTGFEPSEGHRIVEIGAVELFNSLPTGRTYHQYINPERGMPVGAFEVHGIGHDILEIPGKPVPGGVTLKDKPVFARIGQAFLDFIGDAQLVIHNAAFDVGFLNAELAALGRPGLASLCTITDTLALARSLHPGKRNSLDALCERYRVDHSRRTLHGALLDAQLLADVWVAMTRGQDALDIAPVAAVAVPGNPAAPSRPASLRVIKPSPEETAAHAALCERIDKDSGGRCLWVSPGGVSPP